MDLFPHSNSDGLLKYIGITIAIAKKWVPYPIVSDVTITIAMWKQPCRQTGNLLKKHRYHYRCMETGHLHFTDFVDFSQNPYKIYFEIHTEINIEIYTEIHRKTSNTKPKTSCRER